MSFIPKAQEIYRHFKGNLYQIVTLAEHSENGELLVIYQALYGDFKIYARPLSMFVERVDKEKYPNVSQEYRFERQDVAWMVNRQEKTTGIEEIANIEKRLSIEETSEIPEPIVTENIVSADVEMIEKTDTDQVERDVAVVQGAVGMTSVAGGLDTEEEPQLDPLLLDFLDADTYEERLNILAALHHRITDDMITTMAIVCDVEVKDGDVETRYAELKNCLLTLDKYEITRLR